MTPHDHNLMARAHQKLHDDVMAKLDAIEERLTRIEWKLWGCDEDQPATPPDEDGS